MRRLSSMPHISWEQWGRQWQPALSSLSWKEAKYCQGTVLTRPSIRPCMPVCKTYFHFILKQAAELESCTKLYNNKTLNISGA